MAREYMCAYHSMLDETKKMTDAEFGRLMRGLLEYSESGREPTDLSERVQMAFDIYAGQIDRDVTAYTEKCNRNRENVSKRWNTTEYNRIQSNTDDTEDTKKKKKKKEKEKENIILSNESINAPAKKRFVPPTLEEVTEYCRSRNSPVDPKKFYEYFDAGNWKDAKGNPVRNWKQKVLTWEKYDTPSATNVELKKPSSFDTDEFMLKALKRTYGEAAV